MKAAVVIFAFLMTVISARAESDGRTCASICADPLHILPARIKALCKICSGNDEIICVPPGVKCSIKHADKSGMSR